MSDTVSSFSSISNFMFQLALLDLKTLRSKYRGIKQDIPHTIIMSATRNHIIEHLAQEEFGIDNMHNYHLTCIEWDRYIDWTAIEESFKENNNEEL